MEDQQVVHIRLSEILEKKRMTKRELARLAGVRHTLVWEMCHNKTKRLPLESAARICEVLNVGICDILEFKKSS